MVNFAVQTGATLIKAALNPLELLDRLNEVCALVAKRRSGLPPTIDSFLSASFVPEDKVVIISSADL